MLFHDVVQGFVTGLPVLLAVGPIALLLVERGMTHGLRRAAPAAVGVAVGDTTFALGAAVAGGAAAAALAPVGDWLRLGGAAVLGVLAAHLAVRAWRPPDLATAAPATSTSGTPAPRAAPDGGPVRAAVVAGTAGSTLVASAPPAPADGLRLGATFLGLTVVNPLTIVLFAGIVVSGAPGTGTPGWVVGMGLASLAVHGGFTAVGHALGATLSDRVVLLLRRAAPVLVGGLALHLALG